MAQPCRNHCLLLHGRHPGAIGLDGTTWFDRRVLACGEPPCSVAANQYVERHFRERACSIRVRLDWVALGIKGVADDVSNDDVIGHGEGTLDLVAGGGSAGTLLLESGMNRVQLVIAVDSGTVGAAPCHVSREVAIADGGVALVPSLLKLGDERSYRRVSIGLCFDPGQVRPVVVIGH
jgi:hypothetical protein